MEKHYAIFKSNQYRTKYYTDYGEVIFDSIRELRLCKQFEPAGHFTEWEGEIPKPQLESGEFIYIDAIDKILEISRVVRTTSDKIIYFVKVDLQNVIIPDDEISIKSKEEALQKIAQRKAYVDDLEKKRIEEFNQIKYVKKWYQFWK